jgi:streptogramin lyase
MQPLARTTASLALVVATLALPGAVPAGADGAPTIRTIAGGIPDGLPATDVSLTASALDYDDAGNLFIADPGQGMVWKVTHDGTIHHIAGLGRACPPDPSLCTGENGPATEAFLRNISGIAVASNGDVYVSEQRANRVRRIDAQSGIIQTVVGNGQMNYNASADGGPGTDFALGLPSSLDLDSKGNLYITSLYHSRIYRLTPDGTISTVAGCGSQRWPDCFFFAQDGSAVEATPLLYPLNGSSWGIAIGPDDELYIGDVAQVIKLDSESQSYRVIAGKGFDYAASPGHGEGGPANKARFGAIVDLAFDPTGNLYIMEGGGSYDQPWSRLQMIEAPVSPESKLVHIGGKGTGGGYAGDGGPARNARFSFSQPTNTWSGQGIAVAPDGDLVVGDYWNSRVRRIDSTTNVVTTIAGNGYGGAGDYAHGLSQDMQAYNNIQFGLWPAGGFSGDGGPATDAQLFGPVDVEVDRDGNVYVLDRYSRRVRRISAVDGTITTVVGSGCAGQRCPYPDPAASFGDGGSATAATLGWPTAIALDRTGTQLYILDRGSKSIRQVNLGKSPYTAFQVSAAPVTIEPGEIESVIGPGGYLWRGAPLGNVPGLGVEGMSHEKYSLGDYIGGLAADSKGNVYFSETSAGVVMKLDVLTGLVTTTAGVFGASDCQGDAEEGLPGRATQLCGPTGLDVSGETLYIAETGYQAVADSLANGYGDLASRIRAIDLSTPAATSRVVAGNGLLGLDGDGLAATNAQLAFPHGIEAAPDGSIYVADSGNSRIRRIKPDGTIETIAGIGQFSSPGDFSGCTYGGDGGPATQAALCAPMGLAIGLDGRLYVADQINNRVRVIEGL